jgi:hypothetical protein
MTGLEQLLISQDSNSHYCIMSRDQREMENKIYISYRYYAVCCHEMFGATADVMVSCFKEDDQEPSLRDLLLITFLLLGEGNLGNI